MKYGTLTDALHDCNVGYDTLPLALEAYAKGPPEPKGTLFLSILLDTFPHFFFQRINVAIGKATDTRKKLSVKNLFLGGELFLCLFFSDN